MHRGVGRAECKPDPCRSLVSGRSDSEGTHRAAFGQRAAAWNATGLAIWQDAADDADEIAWARAVVERLAVASLAGVGYANYAPADEPVDRVQLVFGREQFDRLVAVKRRHDPGNRFRFNLNVPPGVGGTA